VTGRPTFLPGTDPRANLETEELRFNDLRKSPAPQCLFYFCQPSIILGRANREDEWINAAAARQDGVPVLRRFSGGGAVYLDLNVLNYSFTVPKAILAGDSVAVTYADGATQRTSPAYYIQVFRSLVTRALAPLGGTWSATGTSDISLNGRKISGNAQRIAANLVLHHGTVMLNCPIEAINRYLLIPPNRPGIPHDGFVTGLDEEGLTTEGRRVAEMILTQFTALTVK